MLRNLAIFSLLLLSLFTFVQVGNAASKNGSCEKINLLLENKVYPVRSFPKFKFGLVRNGVEVFLVKNRVERVPLGVLGYGDLDENYADGSYSEEAQSAGNPFNKVHANTAVKPRNAATSSIGADAAAYDVGVCDLNYDGKPEFLIRGISTAEGCYYNIMTHLGDVFPLSTIFDDEIYEFLNPEFDKQKRKFILHGKSYPGFKCQRVYDFIKGKYVLQNMRCLVAGESINLKIEKVRALGATPTYYIAENLQGLRAVYVDNGQANLSSLSPELAEGDEVVIHKAVFQGDDSVRFYVTALNGNCDGWLEAGNLTGFVKTR